MVQNLKFPTFRADNPTQFHTYQRTIKEGGFRLEQEQINNKQILHNYGQADAEFSLSYGSAYMISKILSVKQDATKIKQVAVIGHNVNAMMTSLQLLKRGYKVTLYTDRIPVRRNPQNVKIVENQEGMQVWYPGGYDNCDPLKHELLAKLSFEFFKQCLSSNRYQSLRWVTCYVSGPRLQDLKANIADVKVGFGNQKLEDFTAYKTIMIDTELFIQEIFTELKLRNIIIVEKHFNNLQQVLQIKQKYIFNCLSTNISQIFSDPTVQQNPGCYFTIKLEQKMKEQFVVWVSSQIQKEDFIVAVSRNKVQIHTQHIQKEQKQKIQQIADKVLSRAYHFIKERTVKPYKL